MPTLELQSAVVGVEMMMQIKEDMEVCISQSWLHTDSLTTYFRLQSKEKKQPVLRLISLIRFFSLLPGDFSELFD